MSSPADATEVTAKPIPLTLAVGIMYLLYRSCVTMLDMGMKMDGAPMYGRLYLYFECLRVGVAGFTALATRHTSSFVNTEKRNGCASRK
jgi:hypothetical protein